MIRKLEMCQKVTQEVPCSVFVIKQMLWMSVSEMMNFDVVVYKMKSCVYKIEGLQFKAVYKDLIERRVV